MTHLNLEAIKKAFESDLESVTFGQRLRFDQVEWLIEQAEKNEKLETEILFYKHQQWHGEIKMSFISLQRLLNIVCDSVDKGGEIDKYEVNTLTYLIGQCTEEQQVFLKDKYEVKLGFLFS